jgi:hypothetical protein
LVVSAGDVVLVDESAEDCCAVDAVLGEVDGVWWSGFGLRWTVLVQGAVGPVFVVVLQKPYSYRSPSLGLEQGSGSDDLGAGGA